MDRLASVAEVVWCSLDRPLAMHMVVQLEGMLFRIFVIVLQKTEPIGFS